MGLCFQHLPGQRQLFDKSRPSLHVKGEGRYEMKKVWAQRQRTNRGKVTKGEEVEGELEVEYPG